MLQKVKKTSRRILKKILHQNAAKSNEKYLINIVLIDEVDCFADVDFVSPPSSKSARSSSLIVSFPISGRLISE